MSDNRTGQSRGGAILVAAAAVAWSTAPFFARLLHLDAWTILFWRGIFGGASIILFLVFSEGRLGFRSLTEMRFSAWLVALLSAVGMITFIPALQLTSVANVAMIIAAQPFAAAVIAFLLLKERCTSSTLIASAVAFIGIGIIVSGVDRSADYAGVALACVMMLSIGTMTVLIRKHRETSMVAPAAVANVLASLVSIPFANSAISVSYADLTVLALFGVLQVGMGLTLFSLGSRLLSPGRSSLIATLETPLMPLWVFLAFGEVPTWRAVAGGSLVIVAVFCDIFGAWRHDYARVERLSES